jgi:hypothetical protein
MNGINTDLKDQYQICRNEIIRRLTKEWYCTYGWIR